MIALPELLAFAHQLADEAAKITRAHFRQPINIESKSDNSPVTLADKATEKRLRCLINHRYPQHGIIGEEQENQPAEGEFEWVIDPIDGTRNFIAGYPLYGTLIALLKAGRPILSLIDMPILEERFFATCDSPTCYTKQGKTRQLSTSGCQQLERANLFSTDYAMFSTAENRQLHSLRQSVAMVRYNGDCYLYAMLAAGWIDIVVESDLKIYDFIPLQLIVQQAGGMITDWQGKPLSKTSRGQVLACANADLQNKALVQLATE